MAHEHLKPFGSLDPFAEPAWYNALDSPYYNDSHRTFRKFVRDYLETNVLPYSEQWEKDGFVPLEERVKYARSGLAFAELPKEYRRGIPLPGGIPEEQWDIFHQLILHDETSRVHGGAMGGLAGTSVIGLPPIIKYGTQEQKDKYLPGGSDLASLRTTAKKSPDGKYYVVNGHKKWISGALSATHMTTAVRTGGPGKGGVSILVIPTNSKGFSARKIENSGVNAAETAWVDLEDVHVPVENLVGPENEGFRILMHNFNSERFIMAIHMNRKARVCLEVALDYSHSRITFGKPLISHQIIRHKFVTMARYIESHWAWLEQIAYHIKLNGWESDIASRIALAKIHAGRILELANREAQQVLGGAGYQRGGVGGLVELISRDLRMQVVGGGSEEILSDLALRQELTAARKRGSML
ncbi:hypothetical protein Z517_07973 [Fonsecaea pedrosoi CBS 271.37]|uniref:Acyl-CoA dehydrogenase n=1 Tax=Fonsecaea pedrosoi CBS 271.37 TaxID=1442368 RepID=A0A0D2GHT1_9EURO|nr:uncharacterized protein Z517_07973 [Fonsecaea pedrosoi CBS 271.37]KIW78140.1 hypothetical protein Z517_07973 [Fonsecaea pedrosoi CBS 271.37]